MDLYGKHNTSIFQGLDDNIHGNGSNIYPDEPDKIDFNVQQTKVRRQNKSKRSGDTVVEYYHCAYDHVIVELL